MTVLGSAKIRPICESNAIKAIAKEEQGSKTMSGGEGLSRKRGGQVKRIEED